jgi:hypothetical protein
MASPRRCRASAPVAITAAPSYDTHPDHRASRMPRIACAVTRIAISIGRPATPAAFATTISFDHGRNDVARTSQIRLASHQGCACYTKPVLIAEVVHLCQQCEINQIDLHAIV